MKKIFKYMFLISIFFGLFASCTDIKNKTTTIKIIDNNRHYYPLLMGQELDIVFDIQNTGKHPLIITDIITSCGCIALKKTSIRAIPAGETRKLIMKYDSGKNIGYVKHYITLYGNFASGEIEEIVFDLNVVPNALYTKDYEEIYQHEKDKMGGIKGLSEGDETNRGYYLDEDF